MRAIVIISDLSHRDLITCLTECSGPRDQTDELATRILLSLNIKINQAWIISNISNKKSESLTKFLGMNKFSYTEPTD